MLKSCYRDQNELAKPKIILVILIILILLFSASCKRVEWFSETPAGFHGVWVESDETWTGSMEVRQQLVLSARTVSWLANEDGFVDLPVVQVSASGNKWVIFCGAPNEDHIASTRLSLIQRGDGRLVASEIVSTGWSGPGAQTDTLYEVGVFRRR